MRVVKVAVAIVVAIGVLLAVRLLPVGPLLAELQAYVRGAGPLGYVVYAIAYGVVALFFPASVLTIGAGAIFGLVAGTVVVAAGATLAATLAFLLARTVLRGWVTSLAARDRRFAAVDRAIGREGTKIVFLVRLSALFPFTIVNYLFGLTAVPLSRYVAATAIGILPGTIAFVAIGAAGAAAATQERTRLLFLIVGVALALAVSIVVGRIATQAIRRAGIEDAPPRYAEEVDGGKRG